MAILLYLRSSRLILLIYITLAAQISAQPFYTMTWSLFFKFQLNQPLKKTHLVVEFQNRNMSV